jgi:small-conductance mechanosensitive channel
MNSFIMLWASDTVKSIVTVAILLVLIIAFFIQRNVLNPEKHEVKKHTVILIYVGLFILLFAAIVGVLAVWGYNLSMQATQFIEQFVLFIENSVASIIGSLLVILFSMLLYKIARIALFRVGKAGSSKARRKKTIAKVTLSILKYTIVLFALLIVLSMWGINVLPAIAGLGIAGLVIGLGAQKFINDLISGFFIIFEHHYDVGDKIEVKGFKGEVIDIGLKTTKIKNWKGEVKILNNGDVNDITNFAMYESVAVVDFGIAYQEDISSVLTLVESKLPELKQILPQIIDQPKVLGVVDLAASSVNCRIIATTRNEEHYEVERVVRRKIKEWLDEAGIEIPYPQVVVNQPKDRKN